MEKIPLTSGTCDQNDIIITNHKLVSSFQKFIIIINLLDVHYELVDRNLIFQFRILRCQRTLFGCKFNFIISNPENFSWTSIKMTQLNVFSNVVGWNCVILPECHENHLFKTPSQSSPFIGYDFLLLLSLLWVMTLWTILLNIRCWGVIFSRSPR